MFERAVGYTRESTKIFLPAGASKPVYAPFLEHVPPDPRADEFWLINRAPDRWKNKKGIAYNEAIDSPLRLLAEQISRHAIRPRLPEPKVIERADIEPSAIRAQQPAAPMPNVIAPTDIVLDERPVTRAPVVTSPRDEDEDPRQPRIHTVSREIYEVED
jgi:hypothetical protein